MAWPGVASTRTVVGWAAATSVGDWAEAVPLGTREKIAIAVAVQLNSCRVRILGGRRQRRTDCKAAHMAAMFALSNWRIRLPFSQVSLGRKATFYAEARVGLLN